MKFIVFTITDSGVIYYHRHERLEPTWTDHISTDCIYDECDANATVNDYRLTDVRVIARSITDDDYDLRLIMGA